MDVVLRKEYEASLKSVETENYLDQWFYRPIGFRIACALRNTGVTPNMVTVVSIFVGAAAGPLFYFGNWRLTVFGILCLILANILDCVDGQLARLTGIKSEIGRILDGIAGDIWFTLIYAFLALRLKEEYGTWLFFIPAVLSGFSHLVQANITDYYKTLHLYFVSKDKGSEFQDFGEVRNQYKKMKQGIRKFLFLLYMGYTIFQEKATPELQNMLRIFHSKYGDDIPENIRRAFRLQSGKLMKRLIDWMTFNGRTIALFAIVLFAPVWWYFIFEFVFLNVILALSIRRHEKMCASFVRR